MATAEWDIDTAQLDGGGRRLHMTHRQASIEIAQTRPRIGATRIEVWITHGAGTEAWWVEKLEGDEAVQWMDDNTYGRKRNRRLRRDWRRALPHLVPCRAYNGPRYL